MWTGPAHGMATCLTEGPAQRVRSTKPFFPPRTSRPLLTLTVNGGGQGDDRNPCRRRRGFVYLFSPPVTTNDNGRSDELPSLFIYVCAVVCRTAGVVIQRICALVSRSSENHVSSYCTSSTGTVRFRSPPPCKEVFGFKF